jgi:hypothetical protein
MDRNSGKTISIWMATAEVPEQSTLAENVHSEVCIVGAGIPMYANRQKDS